MWPPRMLRRWICNENGLQRRRFLPAIALIDRHMSVERLDSGTDYRLNFLRKQAIYRVEGVDNLFSKTEFRALVGELSR
ncbi:MAG: hypothetical protein Ct9H300mP8_08150 [Gammaproteobacteria bacterium]|nr:MAG: hypothetical protein Ct9H300mP8_08150 [Gammaproteobacteria bacterium]